MNTKTVYLYDESGVFTQVYEAQADPMEPGKFIEPILSTAIPPPAFQPGERAVWSGNAWTIEQDPTDPTPVIPTQAELIDWTRIKAKTMLLQILPLLDSLQVDALTDGSTVVWQGETTPLAEVIRQLKAGLRSVADMDLSAYETAQQMEDAVQEAYFALALQAPAQVKSAFSALVPK